MVGLGLTGSYLVCRLAQETTFEIHGFERRLLHKKKDLCGWATRLQDFQEFVQKSDLPTPADELILYDGTQALMQIGDKRVVLSFPKKFMGTINKTRFQDELQALAQKNGAKLQYGTGFSSPHEKYDLIIDATGFQRSVIGKATPNDCLIHCFQHTVQYGALPMPAFFFEMYPDGYLWYFPIGENRAHVGCGSLTRTPRRLVQQFLETYPPEQILSSGNKPLRVSPPSTCIPLTTKNTVAVGEAAGVVRPLIGEGIIQSLESADLLLEAITDLNSCCPTYETALLKHFKLNEREWAYFQARIQRKKLACLWHGLRIPMPMEMDLTLRKRIQLFKAM